MDFICLYMRKQFFVYTYEIVESHQYGFYAEENFYVPICNSRYDKILKTCNTFQISTLI